MRSWTGWREVGVGNCAIACCSSPYSCLDRAPLASKLRFRPETHSSHVREVLRNFGPVVGSRGVVQLSGWIDLALASWLPDGFMAAINAAQSIYMLPVSLFGMAVSAAELPAMSSSVGTESEIAARLRQRLQAGLRQIAFFIVPSAMAFFARLMGSRRSCGESGRFVQDLDSVFAGKIAAGSAVGLLASTLGRLYSSTYQARSETRARRPVCGGSSGVDNPVGSCGRPPSAVAGARPALGREIYCIGRCRRMGRVHALRRTMNARIGVTGVPAQLVAKLWGAAAIAAAAAWAVKLGIGSHHHPVILAIPVLSAFGVAYFATTYAMNVPSAPASSSGSRGCGAKQRSSWQEKSASPTFFGGTAAGSPADFSGSFLASLTCPLFRF